MAREIASRLLIKGTMTAQTPLHVGGYGTSPDTDLPLAQNGRGEWYVPGTSLTGVIRSWCERAWPDDDHVAYLFGPPMRRGDEDSGHASFVLIEDAVVSLHGKPIEIRDGVGIDRVSGTAAEGIKFDRAILPRSSQLDFQMTVEIAARNGSETTEKFQQREAHTKAVIGHLLAALQNEELRFGAARTRGLGRVKLETQASIEQTLNTRNGILRALRCEGVTRTVDDLQAVESAMKPHKQPRLEVEIKWRPKGALMVKAGYEGVGVDMLPLVSGVDDGVALVLPGSSIKGALRSQAERIVRTVKPEVRGRQISETKFADQIELKLINELFGARNKPAQQGANRANDNAPRPGLGALSVDDCYAKKHLKREVWQRAEAAAADPSQSSETWELRKLIDPELKDPDCVTSPRFEISHHVAIDRWTGGASDGALFSLLAPHIVEWETIRLTIDLKRVRRDEHLACVALLLFVLRDLMQNRIPLGFATNRGMGEIEVDAVHLHTTLSGLPEAIALTAPGNGDERKIFSEFDSYSIGAEKLLSKLSSEWQRVLDIEPSKPTPGGKGPQA